MRRLASWSIVVLVGVAALAEARAQSACLSEAELSAWRVRVLQHQFAIASLLCKEAEPPMADSYRAFLNKFAPGLDANGREVRALTERRGLHFDRTMTDLAGRVVHRAMVDREYCARNTQALARALGESTTSPAGILPDHDFTAEVNLQPCAAR